VLGLAVGLAFWAKYSVVVLVIPLALFMVWDRQARKSLFTLGPWLAVALALAVSAPHFIWLVRHDFLTPQLAHARAPAAQDLLDHLRHPAEFRAGQAFFLVPSILIAAPLGCLVTTIVPGKRGDTPTLESNVAQNLLTLQVTPHEGPRRASIDGGSR
jgi:4-amino-4-deoxy-L-arabinose transferase-like glycosyltransferase